MAVIGVRGLHIDALMPACAQGAAGNDTRYGVRACAAPRLKRRLSRNATGTMHDQPARLEVPVMFILRALLSRSLLPRQLAALATVVAVATLTFTGCAGWFGGDPVRVNVAGIEPIDSQGLEMRFNVKLRVQNPNESAVSFDGLSLDLELNGKPFASGVSDQSGTVPRYGETVVNVPLTVPAFAAVRQAFAFAGAAQSGQMPYILRGKLAGGLTGTTRFVDQGTLSLPSLGMALP
jgi:LEA14-like dessication related protein